MVSNLVKLLNIGQSVVSMEIYVSTNLYDIEVHKNYKILRMQA